MQLELRVIKAIMHRASNYQKITPLFIHLENKNQRNKLMEQIIKGPMKITTLAHHEVQIGASLFPTLPVCTTSSEVGCGQLISKKYILFDPLLVFGDPYLRQ